MERFAIYPVNVGEGMVALSPLPGRDGNYARDLQSILSWRPDMVLSMTTEAELQSGGAGSLGSDLALGKIKWVHLPIVDFGAPSPATEALWRDVCSEVATALKNAGRILVHCKGGCGRSGMIAMRLMVEHGERPDQALARLRAVRPCAAETDAQLKWASKPAQTPR